MTVEVDPAAPTIEAPTSGSTALQTPTAPSAVPARHAPDPDVIVVGGGHNGLVAAAYLAGAGLRVLVLERRKRVGGIADTKEIAPGVRAPGLAMTVGRIRPSVVRELELRRHGLSLVAPDARVFAPAGEGAAITLWTDATRTAAGLRAVSARDAAAWPAFDGRIRALASFVAKVNAETPPDPRSPGFADALLGFRLARAYRGLGAADARDLLRVLPMPVADLVEDAFETDALRGVLAARGIQHTAMGPRSAGTSYVLVADSAGSDGGAPGQTVYARGGPGALAMALARAVEAAGGEIRTDADVIEVLVRDDRAVGVVLAGGEEIHARTVVAGIDPKSLLTRLLDPVVVGPTLRWRALNLRTQGTVARVDLVLSGLPRFPSAGEADSDDAAQRLRARIVIAPSVDYVERAFDAAKYGRTSEAPFLEVTIPSLVDPGLVAGAPAGTQLMCIHLQYAPRSLREGSWDERRDERRNDLADLAIRTLEPYAPGIGGLVTARRVLTPADLERDLGTPGGHPYHVDPALDNVFLWRPLLGHARYRMPVAGLYLAGSGAHPGGGITGGPGRNAAREILADLRRR